MLTCRYSNKTVLKMNEWTLMDTNGNETGLVKTVVQESSQSNQLSTEPSFPCDKAPPAKEKGGPGN